MESGFKILKLLILMTFIMVVSLFAAINIYAAPDNFTIKSNENLPAASMSDAAYGNGVYIAVGYYGAIIKSTDSNTWVNVKTLADNSSYTGVSNPSTFGFSGVAFGNGIFVAGGNNGVILTSANGTTWTQRTSNITSHIGEVEYLTFNGSSAFYALTQGKYIKSTDGITWTIVTPSGADSQQFLTDITVGNNGTRLAVGESSGKIFVTTNGTNWSTTQPTSPAYSSGINMLKWVNDRYIISDPSAYIWYSTDLSSFTLMGSPFKQTAMDTSNQMFIGFYDGSKYYLFGYQSPYGYGAIYTSTNGTSWTMQTYTNYFVTQNAVILNGKYFRLGNEGMMISSDGTNWSYKWGGTFNEVLTNGTQYVAVGKVGGDGAIFKSSNLETWTQVTLPSYMKTFTTGAYGNSKFVAIGELDGTTTTLATSSDGTTWTKQTGINDSSNICDVAFGNGKFVAVGNKQSGGNTVASVKISSDGVTWSSPTLPATTVGYTSFVTYANNQFVILGSDGTNVIIWTSPDGATWTSLSGSYPVQTDTLQSLIYDGTKYILLGYDSSSYELFTRTSTNFSSWSSASVISNMAAGLYGTATFARKGSNWYTEVYNKGDEKNYVYYTSNGGTTWQNTGLDMNTIIPLAFEEIDNEVVIAGDLKLFMTTATDNATPTITAGGTTSFTEQTQTAAASGIIISDSDGDTDWNGGTLQVQITANNQASDTLTLPAVNGGGIWLNGTTLQNNTTVIGTASATSASNGTAWTLTFNGNATNALVQSTARTILFNNTSDAPSISNRTITFTATDKNSGSSSATQSISITRVNDSPTGLPTITGTMSQGQIITANTETIGDPDGLGAFSYKWQVSDDGTSGWSDIASATSSTYTLALNQAGKYVRVQVSYTDLCGTQETLNSLATSNWVKELTADTTLNDVDHNIDITFTVDSDYEGAITGVKFNGTSLNENTDYVVDSGKVTLKPSGGNVILRTPDTGNVVIIATGYEDASVSQTITAGEVASIVVSTQPVPGLLSSNSFTVQPIVTLKDQYNNTCANGPSASASVVASAKSGTGAWTVGGTTTKSAVAGVTTFTDLTATLVSPGNGAITFTSGSVNNDSNSFSVPNKAAKVLTADTSNNSVDNDIEITFNTDTDFEGAITVIKFNGVSLNASTDYVIENGKLTLKPSGGNSALTTPDTGNVIIIATGYNDSAVSQTITAGAAASIVVSTQPVPGTASGDTFLVQPIITLKDQYNNICTNGPSASASIVASAKNGTGTWTIGGTTTKSAVAGIATFTNLACTLTSPGQGAITFTSTFSVDSSNFDIPIKAAKELISDTTNNDVDHDIIITFNPDTSFQNAITEIKFNGNSLTSNTDYEIGNGSITLKPSGGNSSLRIHATGNVVIIATGYNDSIISQTITAGAVAIIVITTQPVPGTASSDTFLVQPIITLKDQYNNICTNGPSASASIVASAKNGTGTWTIGGTTTKSAVAGIATFNDLSCILTAPGKGSITFTSTVTIDSSDFNIPLKAAKALTADLTENDVDHNIVIEFTHDADFEASITVVKYNDYILNINTDYEIGSGILTLKTGGGNTALTKVATGNVVIMATGYNESTVSQTIKHGALAKIILAQDIKSPNSNRSKFAQQPVITLVDAYGNTVLNDSTTEVTASKKDTGNWTLKGTLTLIATNGVISYSDLEGDNSSYISNAQIAFNSGTLAEVTSTSVSLPAPYIPPASTPTPTPTLTPTPTPTPIPTPKPTPTPKVPEKLSDISITGDSLPKNEQVISDKLKDIKVGILVDGNKKDETAKANVELANDKVVVTVVVDKETAMDKLKEAKKTITIPAKGNLDTFVGQLDGDMIKTVEGKSALVEIKTDTASYSIPATEIKIDKIADKLGDKVQLKDVAVKITIEKSSLETVKVVENTAKTTGFSIVAPPIDFNISVSHGDKKVELDRFDNYIERTVAIPSGVDPSKITTGIIIDQDGKSRHVPTKVSLIDGKYYAKINSLTNSTYSVVWHPIEFKDVATHWAKTAVNDMGSRMVVSGKGNDIYEPDKDITRAEFAAIIVRALGLKPGTGKNPFSDVNSIDWYYEFIQTACEYGIISGYGDGSFGPLDKITREQAMTMNSRAMKITGLKAELKSGESKKLVSSFTDSSEADLWAIESIAACIKTGIVSGRSMSSLAPKDKITKAEVAVIVKLLLQKSNLI